MPIRVVRPDEFEILSELGRKTYFDHYDGYWSEAGVKHYLNNHFEISKLQNELKENGNIRYFFYEIENLPIGFIKLKMLAPLPTRSEIGMELEKIYFLKNYTGKGFGTEFIRFVENLAIQNSSPFIWLDVLKSNTKGIQMYERMGFEKIAEIPFATDIRDIGFFVMKKEVVL